MRRLLAIVEGHGDANAVPLLIRNILNSNDIFDVDLCPTQRRGEYPSVDKNFDNYFLVAIKDKSPIIWIMDFDAKKYDCPYKEASKLIARASKLRPGWPIEIAFLVKEYEVLFLYDEKATRKIFSDISTQVEFPPSPKEVRGAKEWLSEQRPRGKAYKETVHQEKITAHLDLNLLREKSADFAHLERSILKLVGATVPD